MLNQRLKMAVIAVGSDDQNILALLSYEEGRDVRRAGMEKTLNIAGYFPGFSSISGSARAIWGVAEIIVSVVKAPFLLIRDLFSSYSHGKFHRSYLNFAHSGHAILNLLRGVIESAPVIGNVTCAVYDLMDLRIGYAVENKFTPTPFIFN
jgi:hypothetical protein